jgi:hypothetical protein
MALLSSSMTLEHGIDERGEVLQRCGDGSRVESL